MRDVKCNLNLELNSDKCYVHQLVGTTWGDIGETCQFLLLHTQRYAFVSMIKKMTTEFWLRGRTSKYHKKSMGTNSNKIRQLYTE